MRKVHVSPLRIKDHQWSELDRIYESTVAVCDRGCNNGYIEPTDDGFTQVCDCMATYRLLREYVISGIPKSYWSLTMDELSVHESYKKPVKKYIASLDNAIANALGIMFMGPNGIGKTSMMIEIGKAAIIEHFGVRYMRLSQYLTAALGKNDELLEDIESSDFILLDELDKIVISKSDWPLKTTEEFIREVVALGKGLIVATNLDSNGLKDTFGESMISALQRNLLIIPVEGDDYSTRLQSNMSASWEDKLEGSVDFNADSILRSAEARENFRIQVERESWSPYFANK